MKDVLPALNAWIEQGEEIAVATVINTWGSSPRPVGSKLITTMSGRIAGSVSAGCVEGTVIEECKKAMQTGQPARLTYGVADDDAWDVGLACGGTIEIFVEPFAAYSALYDKLSERLETHTPAVLISVLEDSENLIGKKLLVDADGSVVGDCGLIEQVPDLVDMALEHLDRGRSRVEELDNDVILFFEVYPPVSRLLIVGAVHIADPLITMANLAGFRTILIDPRAAFNTRERFPHADELICGWPQHVLPEMALDRSAYVAILTHDPKIDDPALRVALTSEARYVGALGSRRTNELRCERLRAGGIPADRIARLHAPIGLYIGGRSPVEIAVSIMAELIQIRSGAASTN
ncbi:MAG: XdhC family protein [Anaerolineae bacterium]|nr:XdhC family protein [Anaerolineae bacterium]